MSLARLSRYHDIGDALTDFFIIVIARIPSHPKRPGKKKKKKRCVYVTTESGCGAFHAVTLKGKRTTTTTLDTD